MEDSLKRRYFFKLSSNLIGFALGFVTMGIVPRTLGPAGYGDYSFLTNFFQRITGFLDTGVSQAFYNKISHRRQDYKIVLFYFGYLSLASTSILLFVIVSRSAASLKSWLWPEQQFIFIFAAAILSIAGWYQQALSKMADAYALTAKAEIAQIWQKIFSTLLIVLMFYFSCLNLGSYFIYNYAIILFLVLWWLDILRKSFGLLFESIKSDWHLTGMEIRGYTREFYSYCSPLFVLALGGLVLGIFDRWILQRYAGSVQQGFFAFSYQLGAACFIFTVSMTPLITRDFSISFAKKDMEGMARAFRRYIPLFYAISAFLCCFLSVQAGNIISIFGGKSYAQALLAIQIMAFYPIHQTYGQLSGAVFYATGQTRLYRNIGLLFGIIGIPLTIFLLNPTFGINAGAAGLAVKMVVLQFIAVNIQLYFNARLLKLPFLKYIAHQVLSIGVLFSLSLLCAILINIATLNTLIRFLSEGILYALLVGIVVYFWPALFGMKSEDIFNLKKSARNYILKRSVK